MSSLCWWDKLGVLLTAGVFLFVSLGWLCFIILDGAATRIVELLIKRKYRDGK
jgi:hypothetical protein